jgi:hypothetical protein
MIGASPSMEMQARLFIREEPEPLGKPITMTHYKAANLYHDIITGRSVTAILHFLNKFPIDWYSKKQATVKTATYGCEYISARTCVNQIVDLQTTLQYFDIPIRDMRQQLHSALLLVAQETQCSILSSCLQGHCIWMRRVDSP